MLLIDAVDRPLQPRDKLLLRFVPEPLLMPMRFHALAALMLRNFRFASFLERAHSDFQIREFRFNHQMRCNATQFSHCSVTSLL
jgi:hypothetical protein